MKVTIGAVVLGVGFVATAGQAASLTEWQMPFNGAEVLQIAAGSSGVFYIDFDGPTGTTFLGTLDVAKGKLKEIEIPFSAGTGMDLQIRPSDGTLFVSDDASSSIAVADVDQRTLRTWTVPANGDGPRSIAFDDTGRVLFLETSFIGPTVVGRLDTASGLVETWQVPADLITEGDDIAGRIVNAADGSIFFNVNGFVPPGKLVRLDPATGVFTAWVTPAHPVAGLAADGTGAVYFQEIATDVRNVARLVPATNDLTEWSVSPNGFQQNMILESAKLFFGTGDSPVGVGELDPTVAGSDSTLLPVTEDPVAPTSVLVSPVVTRHAEKRHGHARGVTTTPTTTTIGPLTIWGTATPEWVYGDGDGAVYFTGGDNVATIGKLVP